MRRCPVFVFYYFPYFSYFVLRVLCFFQFTSAGCHRFTNVAANCAIIRLRCLPASRKLFGMAGATIRFDVLQTLDV